MKSQKTQREVKLHMNMTEKSELSASRIVVWVPSHTYARVSWSERTLRRLGVTYSVLLATGTERWQIESADDESSVVAVSFREYKDQDREPVAILKLMQKNFKPKFDIDGKEIPR